MSLVMAAAVAVDDAAGAARAFPRTTAGIHLEMVFDDQLRNPQLGRGLVDVVWGARAPHRRRGVSYSFYVPFSQDGGGLYEGAHSVAWWQANHPDWLEYRCDRRTPAFEGPERLAPLDITNSAVQAYQWSVYVDPALAAGYDGIAFDNLTLDNPWGTCGHYAADGSWVQQYSAAVNDAAFRQGVIAWAQTALAHIHTFSASATMQINYSTQMDVPVADNFALMTATDLDLDERGFTNWGLAGRHVTTPDEWVAIRSMIDAVQQQGICYTTNGEEPGPSAKITLRERLWVIANYLLVKRGCTYMYMSGFNRDGSQDYGRLLLMREYGVRIGRPLGPARRVHGIWIRRFSAGLALVNPGDRPGVIRLPGSGYRDTSGRPVAQGVTMPPHTGLILLS